MRISDWSSDVCSSDLRDATLLKLTHQHWHEVIDVNLGGCFNMAKMVFEGMKARGFGRIVNISSVNGQAGQYGQSNYAAAKSGMHGLTKALAHEGARYGITVNIVAPGYKRKSTRLHSSH